MMVLEEHLNPVDQLRGDLKIRLGRYIVLMSQNSIRNDPVDLKIQLSLWTNLLSLLKNIRGYQQVFSIPLPYRKNIGNIAIFKNFLLKIEFLKCRFLSIYVQFLPI